MAPGELKIDMLTSRRGGWLVVGAHVQGEDSVQPIASAAERLWDGATEETRQVFLNAVTVLASEAIARNVSGVVLAQANDETLHVADRRPPPPAQNN